jgi:hypothetical protein
MSSQNRWASADIIGDHQAAQQYAVLEVNLGLELTHRPSRVTGEVVAFTEGQRILLCDQDGNTHEFKPHKGVLLYKGKPVELVQGQVPMSSTPRFTASGSVDTGSIRAQTARASRIWVEGIHDAELIEKIWGDDLRVEGIVVEPLHGADDLVERVAVFHPGSNRRLGILLDHLVAGSKESRIAAKVTDANVLIAGHPYVDIWQAIKPEILGITAWPEIPPGQPWKEGIVAAFQQDDDPGAFWHQILGRVSSYVDVETPLINSVEKLIDFVTAG